MARVEGIRNRSRSARGLVVAALAVGATFFACGRSVRHEPAGESDTGAGGVATGGSGARSGTGGAEAGTSGGSEECLAAVRVGCCADPIAAKRYEVDADPCLLEYPADPFDPDLVATCPRPPDCPPPLAPTGCDSRLPPSRLVDIDETGRCIFMHECASDNDCSIRTNCCGCCTCPEPVPAELVGNGACLLAEGAPRTESCADCSTVRCAGCAVREQRALCVLTPGGLRRCEWSPELPAGACTAERSCNDPTTRCIAPDAPPICGANARCAPKPCSTSGECGPNYVCSSEGACVNRSCTSTSQCSGHCVNGKCYDEPGRCLNPTPP